MPIEPKPLTDEEIAYVAKRCARTTAATTEGYRSWLEGALATIRAKDRRIAELEKALSDLVEWAEKASVDIEGEWGMGRSLDELYAAQDVAEEIVNARAMLDGKEGK